MQPETQIIFNVTTGIAVIGMVWKIVAWLIDKQEKDRERKDQDIFNEIAKNKEDAKEINDILFDENRKMKERFATHLEASNEIRMQYERRFANLEKTEAVNSNNYMEILRQLTELRKEVHELKNGQGK